MLGTGEFHCFSSMIKNEVKGYFSIIFLKQKIVLAQQFTCNSGSSLSS